jgi:HK97 family phage major capsid protein
MSAEVERLLADVKASLKEVGDQTKAAAENALKEANKAGDLSRETKATVDKLLADFHGLTNAQAKLQGTLEGLEAKALDMSQMLAAGKTGKGQVQTLGQAVTKDHGKIAAFLKNGGGRMTLDVQNAITSAGGSGGGVIWGEEERTPVEMARRNLRIRNLVMVSGTGRDLITYPRQTTRTIAAAPVAEGAAAPESNLGWTKATADVKKIAHIVHATEEALADSDELQGLIDGEMRYGLDLVEDQQILLGSGVGENLNGLHTQATAFSAAAGLPNATRVDRLRLAILQVLLNDYAADGIVLHPTDWAAIELEKDTTNRYLHGQPGGDGINTLWRLPVVDTATMTAGNWLVGAMRMAATLYDRKQTEVLISTEHGTNFVEGMATVKASKRLALAVKRPSSLVKGNFTFA